MTDKINWKVIQILSAPEPALFGDEWRLDVLIDTGNGGRGNKVLFFDYEEEAEIYVNDFNGVVYD